jgi:hypothetical protein
MAFRIWIRSSDIRSGSLLFHQRHGSLCNREWKTSQFWGRDVRPHLEGDLAPVLGHLHEGEQLHLPDVVRVLQPQAVHELPVLPVFTDPHSTRFHVDILANNHF